jgi:hypothetical protein
MQEKTQPLITQISKRLRPSDKLNWTNSTKSTCTENIDAIPVALKKLHPLENTDKGSKYQNKNTASWQII